MCVFLLSGTLAAFGEQPRITAPRPRDVKGKDGHYLTGHGVVTVQVDQGTGRVIFAQMTESTGHTELDQSALEAFRRWRFKPHTVHTVRIPITFSANPL